ncbi:MAG: flagellar hook assembly protein FlgD [Methylobacter sp.]
MAIQSAINDYSSLTVTPKKESTTPLKSTTLGQEQFLKLLTTQMTHQDPSQPMQNGEFLSQMAQFGTVSGIQDLQKSFAEFASSINSSQALQATSLVGRHVSAPGSKGILEAGGEISGDINLTSSSPNLDVKIINSETGEVVKDMALGEHGAGRIPFVWDGLNSHGVMASPGVYKIDATANIDGNNTALETDINSRVDSISMGSGANGIKVNLTGLDSVNFNQIKQIL